MLGLVNRCVINKMHQTSHHIQIDQMEKLNSAISKSKPWNRNPDLEGR